MYDLEWSPRAVDIKESYYLPKDEFSYRKLYVLKNGDRITIDSEVMSWQLIVKLSGG